MPPAGPEIFIVADLDDLRRLSRLLDAAVRIPGTRLRVGLDPLVGLIPGVGDVVTPLFTGLVLLHAWRRRVPKVVMVRMLVNAGLDALLGAVPIVGDVVDVFWKAASANVRLL
ncbi:MAG TPA: DUF4112 domain-containing protein, partial [Candidatus Limnocylindria bacterium]|nr:DUF4112 domain-containing protein [Candidatus Limnocylindria bacterium]